MTIDKYMQESHRMRRAIGSYEAFQTTKDFVWILDDVKNRSKMEQNYFRKLSNQNRAIYTPLTKDPIENECRIYNCAYESLLNTNKKPLWQMIKTYFNAWRTK